MSKIIKFSKKYDRGMFKIKKNFYSSNDQNLIKKINMNKIYKKQKKEGIVRIVK